MNKTITMSLGEYSDLENKIKKLKEENWRLSVNKENIECSWYYAPYYLPHYSFRGKDEVIKTLVEEIKKSNEKLEFLAKATPKEFKIWKKGDK